MKTKHFVAFLLMFLFSSSSLFAQLDKNETLVYKLIKEDKAKQLEKLMNEDAEFKNYVLTYSSKTEKTYLEQAIDDCSLKIVALLTKHKSILGDTKQYAEDMYIADLSCYIKKDTKECLIPAFVHLVENDYIEITPTLLGKLNCYSDVLPEWYQIIQPVMKSLIKKGLKVEESIISLEGEATQNYLLALCNWEKEATKENYKAHKKAIRKYILFLKEQGIDFNTEIDDKKPIDVLSEEFQKKMK